MVGAAVNERRYGVTFDLWYTLVYVEAKDEERYIQDQIALGTRALETARQVTHPAEAVSPEEAFRQAYQEAADRATQGRSVPSSAQIRQAAESLGRVVDVSSYMIQLAQLVRSVPFRVAPGALAMLKRLKGRGFRLGVISNTVGEPGRELVKICEDLGIARFIDSWTWSDEQPWTKPAVEIFEHSVRNLGTSPDATVHVGDGISDLEGAQRAGFRAGILFRGLIDHYGETYRTMFASADPSALSPPFVIDHLEQLPPLLARIFDKT
ncbi:MAG: HAD family hydrolase [Thermoplasmata archaeon]